MDSNYRLTQLWVTAQAAENNGKQLIASLSFVSRVLVSVWKLTYLDLVCCWAQVV